MPVYTAIPFYLAAAAYIFAAAFSLAFARGARDDVLVWAKRLAAAGNVFLLVVFAVRWWEWGLVPLTGMGDSLNLLLILCTGIILSVQRNESMRPLLPFYLPALALLTVVAAANGHRYLGESPRELNSVMLTVHVGLAFLAFSLFFVASMTSIAYVFKARHLKRHETIGLFQKLPSLEQLDATLYRLISIGYPLFVITLILGFYWAWVDRELLGPLWFASPKILLAVVMVALYSVSFHTRRFGLLRGPKLAYLVFYGFTAILVAYLALGLLQVGQYNFWESAS